MEVALTPLGEVARAPLRVLLLEPHTLVRDGIRMRLAAPDFRLVAEVTTAEEGFPWCYRSDRPEVAIIDLELPDMTGIDATRRLLHLHPELQVVLLVNTDEETIIMEAIRAGARAVVIKTEPSEVLVEALLTVACGKSYLSKAAGQRIVNRIRAGASAVRRTTASLRNRELQVLRLMADGLATKEIAQRLGLALHTARNYRKLAMRKIGAKNAVEAVQIAQREKIFVLTGGPSPLD